LATKGVKAIPRRLSALPPKRTFDSSCGMSALCKTQRELDWHKKTIGMYGVSYVNFARSTQGETYRDQTPAIRLRRSRRAVRCKAQGWPTTAAALSPLCDRSRSEEHTSELQSLTNLVCRLLLEKKKTNYNTTTVH